MTTRQIKALAKLEAQRRDLVKAISLLGGAKLPVALSLLTARWLKINKRIQEIKETS